MLNEAPRAPTNRAARARAAWACTSLGLLPVVTLLAPRGTPWQSRFRPTPHNVCYEYMTVAIGASFALSEPLRHIIRCRSPTDSGAQSRRAWLPDALTCVQVVWPSTQAVLSFAVSCAGAGVLWLCLGAVPLAVLTAAAARHDRQPRAGEREDAELGTEEPGQRGAETPRAGSLCCGGGHTDCAATALRVLLLLIAVGFLAFPVFQSWAGPPEPFVRWHPYSPRGELVFRGTFATFALGHLLALPDPAGARGAPYVAWFALQALLHASAMLAMSRAAATHGSVGGDANANAEHLYGDVAGFYGFCVALPALLAAAGVRLRWPAGAAAPAEGTAACAAEPPMSTTESAA
jgi:hypothetical protein